MNRWKVFLLVGFLMAAPLDAVDTAFWQVGTFEEFLQGTLHEVSLSKEGVLTLAPQTQALFNPDETLALSLAADRKGNIFVGTGHQGKVFRVGRDGKGSLLFTAREPEIFALAVAPDGSLFVGSSPEGKIYRVALDGKSSEFFDPKSKYIWSLAVDSEGNLYAATGDQGKIFRIGPDGKGNVFYDSRQTHIMCLTFDGKANLLAGSAPNGVIFRIDPHAKAFVLYQADLPEIHDLAVDAQGRIYAAALGGAGGKGTPFLYLPQPPGKQVPGQVTTVTVTAETDEAAESKEGQTPAPTQPKTSSFNRPAPQAPALAMPRLPQGRGSLIQILPDSTVETVWSSNNESIFGLAVRGKHVLFSTDSNGRIFDLVPSQDGPELTLLTETRESLASRLLLGGPDLYVATSNIAKLFRLGEGLSREGTYESPVKDTKFISRWGVLAWRGDAPAGSLEFFTRSGNSERPDQTWSDWAGPYRDAVGSVIQSPAARYLQWKAVLRSGPGGGPELSEVTASYLNQNLPPQVRSLNVNTSGERTSPTGTPSTGGSPTPTVTVSVGSPPPSTSGPNVKTQTALNWHADDPNGDSLVYALYVQASDEEEWHLLKDKLHQTSYAIESNALPDGKYIARLVASDKEANPPHSTRSAELISAPFWIDNTPPEVRVLKQEAGSAGILVQFRAEDATSPLRGAETATDGQDWVEIVSDDGIVDSRQETFTIRLDKLGPGEHIVALRAMDTAGNAGLGKAVVRIPAAPVR
jgi:hypothetical protein